MRISKNLVIQTVSDLADENGLNDISLKLVAEKLQIRTPSLYNHINSLDDLLQEAAQKGMETMNTDMTRSVLGKTGDPAIKAASLSYFDFVVKHPGVYEIIQWATWHENKTTADIFHDYQSLLTALILSYHYKEEHTEAILHLIMSLLHGFSTMQLGFARKNPKKAKENLCQAIDTVLLGIHQKYE